MIHALKPFLFVFQCALVFLCSNLVLRCGFADHMKLRKLFFVWTTFLVQLFEHPTDDFDTSSQNKTSTNQEFNLSHLFNIFRIRRRQVFEAGRRDVSRNARALRPRWRRWSAEVVVDVRLSVVSRRRQKTKKTRRRRRGQRSSFRRAFQTFFVFRYEWMLK